MTVAAIFGDNAAKVHANEYMPRTAELRAEGKQSSSGIRRMFELDASKNTARALPAGLADRTGPRHIGIECLATCQPMRSPVDAQAALTVVTIAMVVDADVVAEAGIGRDILRKLAGDAGA